MADVALPAISTEILRFTVEAFSDGAPADPSGFPLRMALVAKGVDPAVGDWKVAAWRTDADGVKWGELLVGPDGGSVTGVSGSTYVVWAWVQGNLEKPRRPVGSVKFV